MTGETWLHELVIDACIGRGVRALEGEILPAYLIGRRWYGANDAGLPKVSFENVVPIGNVDQPYLICILKVRPPGQPSARYLLPLAFVGDAAPPPRRSPATLKLLQR